MDVLDRCVKEIVTFRVTCTLGFPFWKNLKWWEHTNFQSVKTVKVFRTVTITKETELCISNFLLILESLSFNS